MQVLVFNRQFTDTIGPYEKNDEIEKYKEEEARRKLKHEEEAANEAMRAQHDAKEQMAEEEVATEKQRFGIFLKIMQPILSPVQQNLGRTIVHLRIAKRLVTWEQYLCSCWNPFGRDSLGLFNSLGLSNRCLDLSWSLDEAC
jgi:hypothetical protein